MKPNFALSLSFEGIRLLHRAAGGWRVVGDVSLDDEDLNDALAVLRKTATSLEPGGLRTKLLLPNEQIRYLTIDTPDMDEDARRAAAVEALDGATPYAVDELAFDISQDGAQTHIAAVALETLAEAEAFGVEHRFHPVSFVAVPGEKPYLGEPFFGQAKAAADLLEADQTVEPDGIAVVVIGDAVLPDPVEEKPQAAPEKPAEPETPKQEAFVLEAEAQKEPTEAVVEKADAVPAPKPAPKAEPKVETKADTSPDPKPEPKVEAKSEPKAATEPAPKAKAEAVPEPKPETKPEPKPEIQAAPKDAPRAEPKPTPPEPPKPALKPEPTFTASATPSRAPTAIPPLVAKAIENAPGAVPKAPPATPSTTNAPSMPIAEALDIATAPPAAGFASRRNAPPAPDSTSAKADALRANRQAPPIPSVAAADLPIDPDSSSLIPSPMEDDIPPAPRGGFLSRRRAATQAAAAAAPAAMAAAAAAPLPRNTIQTPGSEAERMTVFGARNEDVGGKPRFLGLMLMAALLVFLAGVAAWASVFLDDGLNLSRLFGSREPAATASALQQAEPEVEVEAPAAIAQPEPVIAPTPPAEPDTPLVQTAALDPDLTDTDGAVLDALRRADPLPPRELTPEEVEAKYAATGIYPRAPRVPPEPAGLINIEDLYLTSIDPVSTASDAVALPALAAIRPDTVIEEVPSPAAAGITFTLDERGLVVPTPEGAMSPDGFLVYAGQPPLVPPEPPTRFQTTPQVTQPRPELAGFRPRPRPTDLVESNERAQFDGLSRNELAEYRPELRPESVQERFAAASAAEAAAQASTSAVTSADTQQAVTAALATVAAAPAADPFAGATAAAATASRRPDVRPRNFSRIVQRAEQARPAEVTQVASAAAVAPRTVTPNIPSSASVSRSATVKNAINLRKVNLIGVYGKPSSRRALVRLSNGRYKKVVVGDRIDGGRVSAIGDSELRYTKRGRSVVLKMPKG